MLREPPPLLKVETRSPVSLYARPTHSDSLLQAWETSLWVLTLAHHKYTAVELVLARFESNPPLLLQMG